MSIPHGGRHDLMKVSKAEGKFSSPFGITRETNSPTETSKTRKHCFEYFT